MYYVGDIILNNKSRWYIERDQQHFHTNIIFKVYDSETDEKQVLTGSQFLKFKEKHKIHGLVKRGHDYLVYKYTKGMIMLYNSIKYNPALTEESLLCTFIEKLKGVGHVNAHTKPLYKGTSFCQEPIHTVFQLIYRQFLYPDVLPHVITISEDFVVVDCYSQSYYFNIVDKELFNDGVKNLQGMIAKDKFLASKRETQEKS